VFGHGICVDMQTNLLILVGTFSEDMITTGISLSLDDSCNASTNLIMQSHESSDLASVY
jgi:hypothetical protein